MFKDTLFHFIALVSVLSLATGQQPQQPQQPNAQLVCSTKFESAVGPECFDANGIAFSGVILVLSNNRTGQLPAGQTIQSFAESLCLPANQDKLVPCVLQKMQQNNGSQCTQEDRMGVMGRGAQLLAFLENVCGKQCEVEALQSLAQCFAVTQISPDPILGQNASIIDDKYSIVGINETEYTKFCNWHTPECAGGHTRNVIGLSKPSVCTAVT
ncbi:hypothetical protein Btru_030327 [Bulinus truncatus]|nr:hypothetical protein Btru_030327 [Bulinus truncatus]